MRGESESESESECRVREMQARVRFVPCARATLCGDRVVVDLEEENWRLCSTTVVRGVSGELEDENWRLGSTT